ncbi:hypothetical protein MKA87_004387 [Salmonella enterica]|uniref:hypothetical protein n=1 Tax=Salmonella enterica TaxID=28901 RepID=UPI003315D450|nr:hypothetical protein [Salmonella enterica]EIX3644990.1 hypothetical protein [Salmonella enterica]EIX8205409.1 hypothetical protein [Salmonella enterica subsp. enterica serovar Infantis]
MIYDRYTINRCNAMVWLAEHYPVFPGTMPEDVPLRASWCSDNLFEGWAFVLLEDRELVFADCLSPCIRASDMEGFKLPEVAL